MNTNHLCARFHRQAASSAHVVYISDTNKSVFGTLRTSFSCKMLRRSPSGACDVSCKAQSATPRSAADSSHSPGSACKDDRYAGDAATRPCVCTSQASSVYIHMYICTCSYIYTYIYVKGEEQWEGNQEKLGTCRRRTKAMLSRQATIL